LLPSPPETFEGGTGEEIESAGLHDSFRGHNHSPTLAVCPNGDVLMVTYTSHTEYEPGVSLIGSRLRLGADKWDMPSRMFDFAGANDHAPMLWTDKESGVMYFFWGSPKIVGGFPFQWTTSTDSGKSWAEIQFPDIKGELGTYSRQPINTALRDKNGTLYLATDGEGGESVLFATKNNGVSWYDTGGRTFGRHTTFALLSDGKSILGLGGKKTDIDGFMPQSITRNGGKSYEVSPTPFCRLGSNQRPSVLNLASGRIFFAGDYNEKEGGHPESITEKGCYVALSDDDGKSWLIKTLPGAQQHEDGYVVTIGYSAARQGPDGTIHLITSMNKPNLHFAMNEAWILEKDSDEYRMSDEELMACGVKSVSNVKTYSEKYPNGQAKVVFSGGFAEDGRFLLDGGERWYYEDGSIERSANYKLGSKVGAENYFSKDGTKIWNWQHNDDGSSVWTQYWPNGRKKAQSTWRNFHCEGAAMKWDSDGKLVHSTEFVNGIDINANYEGQSTDEDEDDDEAEDTVGEIAFPVIDIPQGEQHACVEKHLVVYDEPGRYAGWPANGGFWMWGDKMAVSFECGWFKDKPDWEDGHARDMSRSNEDIVARSNDGGLTWTHKTYPALSSDDGMVDLKEQMDFSREGFAFKCQGERFYYTYDYGLTWSGPFRLNIEGRPFDDDSIESHTTYIVTGPKEGYFFFGIEPDGAEDRFYCSKTTDGGMSFQFLGWISPSLEDAPRYERWAVYSAVEVEKGHLIAALRRKINKRRGEVKRLNWIDVYESQDAGKTWSHLSKVADTDVVNSDFNGNPPSIIKLQDGRLAVTYGFRGRPTAMCAKISRDNGKNWGEPVILRRGSRNWDFGYSRSLQRADGKVITVYYWATPEHRNQYLTATIWDPDKID